VAKKKTSNAILLFVAYGSLVTVSKRPPKNKHKRKVLTGKKKWKVTPPANIGSHGDTVHVVVAGDCKTLQLVVPKGFTDPVYHGLVAETTLTSELVRGNFYEFDVYVDGQLAEAASSPGVIIE
jgi:hypothetical protein